MTTDDDIISPMPDYEFETEPYDHQATTFAESWDMEWYAFLMEMGTGKTKVAIDTVGAQYEHGIINALLIVAPKSVYLNWILREIPVHMPRRIQEQTTTAFWRTAPSRKIRKQLQAVFEAPAADLRVLTVNVESLQKKDSPAMRVCETFLKEFDAMMVVDESTTIKNPKAQRTKNVLALGPHAVARRILTGSPVTRDPLDLFSQFGFLDTGILGTKSYYAFRAQYAIMKRMEINGRSFSTVVGFRNLDELREKISPHSCRVLKKDCLDLPDKIYLRREVELTKEQARHYEELKRYAITVLDSGEEMSIQLKMTLDMRLHQIACGHATDDRGGVTELPTNRLAALDEVIAETDGKVIVWATYTTDIRRIARHLREKYGRDSVVEFYGATSLEDRETGIDEFQDPASARRFFVANEQTGGMGVTLTAATVEAYYSNGTRYDLRLQSEDRPHRIGQQNNVTVVDIVAPGTVDEKRIKSLLTKEDVSMQITGDEFREWLEPLRVDKTSVLSDAENEDIQRLIEEDAS